MRRVNLFSAPIWMITILLIPSAVAETWAKINTQKATQESSIQWHQWNAQSFKRAKQEDKLILLDLTAVWCHACHVMDETTYVDSTVVALLNTRFIPIRVDTDQRPDIEARYKHGGWPTTSILLPSGEILFQANSLGPDQLTAALQESDTLYREQKQELVERAAEIWAKVDKAKKTRERPRSGIQQETVDNFLLIMKQSHDQVYGGFRDAPKFFEPDAITLAFEFFYRHQDPILKHMAVLTLDQQLRLFDPVWGGFYRYAEHADWTHPHYEKMLPIQAANLLNYLEAYQITKNDQYRETVQKTIQYVTRFLSDLEHGGFYASQDADVQKLAGSTSYVPGESYYALSERERLALGMPPVDRTVYTGWNGLMVKSYLKAYQVLGDRRVREFALKTLERLHQERYRQGRGVAHLVKAGRPEKFGLLADQVYVAEALLEAFLTTGVSVYLQQAEQIMTDLSARLEDTQGGGFYDRPPDDSAHGLLKFPHKDLEINASLGILYSDLYYVTQKPAYRDTAEQTIQFVLGHSGPLPVARTGRAVNRLLEYPVQIVVVGNKREVQAQKLFRKGLEVYAPGKLVRFLDPEVDRLSLGEVTFPRLPEPRAYVCTDRLCSSPIRTIEELTFGLNDVLALIFPAQGHNTGFAGTSTR